MLKRLLVGFTLMLTLPGCQTQQEKAYEAECITSVPREQCDNLTNPHHCVMVRIAIANCAEFVRREVNRQLDQGGAPALPPAPRYSAPDPTPIILEVINDVVASHHWDAAPDMEWLVRVDLANPEAYLLAARKTERLMAYLLNTHEKDVQFYLRFYDGRSTAPEGLVLRRIAKIEALRAPLDKAVAAGEVMAAFYSNPANHPKEAFEVLADDLVRRLNPGDLFLRKGADAAIRQHGLGSKYNMLAQEIQLGLEKFKAARANANSPMTYAFEVRKAAHLEDLKRAKVMARRHDELQRQPSRPTPEQRARGGSCSCAGGNVCYGPRGGRFCITSGGNKRYGI